MSKSKLAKNISFMSMAVFLSRIFGLLRDILFAYLFGTSTFSDAFRFAYQIPNLLRKLFGEGALAAAFIPIYKEIGVKDNRKSQILFAMEVLSILTLFLTILCILGIFLAPLIVKIVAHGFDKETSLLTIKLTRLMFPYLFFIGISSTLISILNAHDRFFIPGLSSLFLNVGIFLTVGIGYIFAKFSQETMIYFFSAGVLVGGFLQTVINFPQLKKIGYQFKIIINFKTKALRELWYKFLPGVISLAVRQINLLTDLFLASFLAVGSLSALDYGNRLMLLPMGVIGVSAGTAVLPKFSEYFAKKDFHSLNDQIRFTIILLVFAMLPISIIIFVLGDDFIRILLMRGAFDERSLNMTYKAFMIYSSGLVIFSINRILVPIFYANRNTKTPLKVTSFIVILNIILNIILMKIFALSGLAMATVLSSFIQLLILIKLLKRDIPQIKNLKLFNPIIRIILLSIVVGIGLFFADKLWLPDSIFHLIIKDSIFVSFFMATFFALSLIIKVDYSQTFWNFICRKIFRKK